MNIRYLFILLGLALGMTSCTVDDSPMTDNVRPDILASDDSGPSPEHEGGEEELEPNN